MNYEYNDQKGTIFFLINIKFLNISKVYHI